MFWGGRVQGDGASTLLAPISHSISSPLSSNPEAARPPLLTTEADEQPNSNQVWGRSAEIVTSEARRGLWAAGCGGFREGWIVEACEAIQSSRRSLGGCGKVFGVWSKAKE